MTAIKKAIDEHVINLTPGKPEFNWCDLAVQVSEIHIRFTYRLVKRWKTAKNITLIKIIQILVCIPNFIS